MQTADFVLIWLVAMLTAAVIVVLKLVALAFVVYMVWRGFAVAQRVGLKPFAKALGALISGVFVAVAKLFTFDNDDVSRWRNIKGFRAATTEDIPKQEYFSAGFHYNCATDCHDDGLDPDGIYLDKT